MRVDSNLLRKIVVDDERVAAVVAEVLAHGASGVGRQVLQRSSIGGSGADDDRVLHGVGIGQPEEEKILMIFLAGMEERWNHVR